MMVRIKKYGRWNELSNYQLEEVKVEDLPYMTGENLLEMGYSYSKRYNEYSLESVNKLRRIVVTVM